MKHLGRSVAAAVLATSLSSASSSGMDITIEELEPIIAVKIIGDSSGTPGFTTYLLYPGACVDRAIGSWSPRSSPVADSLQPTTGFPSSAGYTDNQPDIAGGNNTIAYTRLDGSLPEKLWHVVNVGTPASQRPAIIDGSNSIWCGKFDPNWAGKVGYPNLTFQILYIDTGTHGVNYTLAFEGNVSTELNYDYFTILGGGSSGQSDHMDPLQDRRDLIGDMLPPVGSSTAGPHGDSDQIVSFTGSITIPQTISMNSGGGLQIVAGTATSQPNTVSYSISIDGDHRALYLVMTADCLFSSEDGLWPLGQGQIIDLVSTSDNGTIYNDETQVGGSDPFSGTIIKGTYGSAGFVSSRVPAGVGELWALAPGSENVTADMCSPQKTFSTDLFFEGGDPNTNVAINKQFNSIVSCSFPIPPGTASVIALWSRYLDVPRYAGYIGYVQYRVHEEGAWSRWQNTSAGGGAVTGALQAWALDGDELAAASQADSVQLRWTVQCVPGLAADKRNCSSSLANALLFDDFRLQVRTGVPTPHFGTFPGSVAQTTFVDGTIDGTNCTLNPCWPGNRGSDLGTPASHNIAIHDNWNAATGDSITLAIVSGLRKNGMGVNWQYGINKQDATGGEDYQAFINASFNPAFDSPRMIYRLFDPATKTWSAFDSTALSATVRITEPDTVVVGGGASSEYVVNWPPDDKVRTGAPLPGGFTINGVGAYSGLSFLPAGTRMQYYFKGVDINGGKSWIFSSGNVAREVEDLPTLPGSSNKAPDIIEWRVLPSVYPAGPAGSLLAGKTDADILNMDDVYTRWSFGYDPIVQALRGLGVRSDRYRHASSGTTAHDIGGHELPGARPDRLSNFFPNYLEYPLVDSLASWYKIMIESGHTQTVTAFSEQDAIVVQQWWAKDTGSNQGDRCFFVSGDDVFNALLNTSGVVTTNQISLAQDVFGVSSSTNAWSGTNSTPYPTIDDRFAAASAGPGLAAANTYTYPVDGGCPGPNRFDALVKLGSAEAASAVFYPNAQIAGIARMSERDAVADKDRNKSIAYGFSIQCIRQPVYPPTQARYEQSGVENRMRVLYKFLTSCRGPRTAAAADTGKCWPCPSPGTTLGLMQGEWAAQSAGFGTGTWGPLYPIQAAAHVTAVVEPTAPPAPYANVLHQNRPNPFNPETTIPYSLGASGRVQIRVFDVAGRRVRTLVDRMLPAGEHVVRWDGKRDSGTRIASGVYFYRIIYPDGNVSSKKMMILR